MELYLAALNYLDVPWKHRGREITGLDCIGLVVRAIEDCGGVLNDRRDYGREPENDGLRQELQSQLTEVDRDPEVNDIVLMAHRVDGPPRHVGIIAPYPLGGLGFVHTYGEVGRVVFTRFGESEQQRLQGVFEWAHGRS